MLPPPSSRATAAAHSHTSITADELLRDPSMRAAVRYVLLACYNIALLPLVAAIPLPLAREAPRGWVSLFACKDHCGRRAGRARAPEATARWLHRP